MASISHLLFRRALRRLRLGYLFQNYQRQPFISFRSANFVISKFPPFQRTFRSIFIEGLFACMSESLNLKCCLDKPSLGVSTTPYFDDEDCICGYNADTV